MNDWTSGYVADISYTYGYYSELNPLRSKIPIINTGIVCAKEGVHCELGFGQGVSININAATSGTTWYGTDFNPAQTAFAKALAQASGADVHLFDQSFEDFCQRDDLPEFNSIGLHGIWSWINDANRSIIVDFIRRKLKVGGVLYISYNTQPGWGAMVPMRDLLTLHTEKMSPSGQSIVSRIDSALGFTDKLMQTNPLFAKNNPLIVERLKKLNTQDRNYLAHEYFNRDWFPMSFAQMSDSISSAKLNYACSANYLDHIAAINLTIDQQNLLKEIADPIFKQCVRDFCVNQQFRKDYWIKGVNKFTALEQLAAVRNERVVMITPRDDVVLKVTGPQGEFNLQEDIYIPILNLLADHKARSLGEIVDSLSTQMDSGKIIEAIMVLIGVGYVHPAQQLEQIERGRETSHKLNSFLLEKAKSSDLVAYLASPVTGGGFPVDRINQLFIYALTNGHHELNDWIKFAWELLSVQGQKLIKEGTVLETQNENMEELNARANVFMTKYLPIYRALLII